MWLPKAYIPYLGILGVIYGALAYYLQRLLEAKTGELNYLSRILSIIRIFIILGVLIIAVGLAAYVSDQPHDLGFILVLVGLLTLAKYISLYKKISSLHKE